VENRTLFLTGDLLADEAAPETTVAYVGDRIVGLTKPEWLDRPPIEQSLDDARSLVFRTPTLEDTLEILGNPVLRVRIAADRPVAKLAARLVELTADGQSWLVSYGLLNLTHRTSHTEPAPLVPGQVYDVEIPLTAIAHRFSAGSRIGLALSESLWPLVWPSPEIVTLALTLGPASTLTLPVRPIETEPAPFDIPETRSPPREGSPRPTATTAPASPGRYRIELSTPTTSALLKSTGTTLGRGRREVSEIAESDPNSCVWSHRARSSWKRGDWDCAVEATCELRSTPSEFQLSESLTAWRGEVVVFQTRVANRIARNLV
jgi:hypothetical protein